MTDLLSFAQLPAKPGNPAHSSWGLWGDDDELGCLNLLTPERIAAAARLVRKGAVFALNLRIDRPDPPLYGRGRVKQTIVGEGGNGRDDYLDNFWPQASSQWDSLRHIRHPEYGWYNGVRDEQIVAGDGGKLGIDVFARRGIAGRGVLLDVGSYLRAQGRPLDQASSTVITRGDLEACRKSQGTDVRTGDILLVRSGWLTWYLNETTPAQREALAGGAPPQRSLRAPGLGPPQEMAAYLWDLHVAAVAADNPALEAWPPASREADGFMHTTLIPLLGMAIGELWWLDDLAADCAADRRYEFFFTSAPLNVPGGVASPPNALALK
ncbi:MAG TPA: cyclase family protein [Dehalococcoidia bacterium]